MARGIKDVIDRNAAGYLRIARTEGQRCAVLGQIAQADESKRLGIKIKRIWDATLDRRTRPEHGRLDGMPAQEHDGQWMWFAHFPDGGSGWTAGPGQSGNASMDISCRCRLREEIEEYPPEVRRIRDEGIQPYITYSDWAKKKGI